MASRDVKLMQANVLQSALVSAIAGGMLFVFQPTSSTASRLARGLVVGCAKRVVNGLAVYACCSMLDAARRRGATFWFLNSSIGTESSQDEYFMSSSFRFAAFAASSGPSCITNYITRLIGLGGPAKEEISQTDGQANKGVAVIKNTKKQTGGIVSWFSDAVQFYDTEGKLRPYVNLARLLVHSSIFGISTVLTNSGLLPVTFGPIDNETHIRVLSKCGPSELAYWSALVSLATVSAETVWNSIFYLSHIGEKLVAEGAEDGASDRSLGFTVLASVIVGVAAAALNGATVYVVSNRAVAILGEEGEQNGEGGILRTACQKIHDGVFTQILDRRKGVAYIWARCVGFISHTFAA